MTDLLKPMLASKVEDVKIDYTKPVFIQPKLDGIRCLLTKDGAFTRNGKKIMNVMHIEDAAKMFFFDNPHLILDGELYTHELKDDFNKIVSLVRKQKPEDKERAESARLIQFHTYDMINLENLDADQEQRELARRSVFRNNFNEYGVIRYVWSNRVDSEKAMRTMHEAYKAEGYEGSIVRLNEPYKLSGRSKALIKVKDWHDAEATITGFVEGQGKFANGLGKFLGLDGDGREVEIPWPTLTIQQRRDMWEMRDEFIDEEITFEYFERTPDGAYRFPKAKAFRNYE